MEHKTNLVYLYCDGCSKPNPGLSSVGCVITTSKNTVLYEYKSFISEKQTNNVAEYTSLILGLKLLTKFKYKNVSIFMDSLLVVKQVNKLWKINFDHLKILNTQVQDLLTNFTKYELTHVLRDKNSHADRLANEAIEERCSVLTEYVYDKEGKIIDTIIQKVNL